MATGTTLHLPPVSIAPPAHEQLIREEQFLHRFCHSQTTLLVVRYYQTASGEEIKRIKIEPWRGL